MIVSSFYCTLLHCSPYLYPPPMILSLKTYVTNELFLNGIQMYCNSWSSSVTVIVTTEKLSS